MDINNEDFQKFLKWCDEQVKHFESLDKAENNSTRYWAGRVDSISACKIYVSALQPSPLPLIECPDIEELIEKFLPNQIDLSSFKPKEVLFIKSAWQHGAIVMFHQLKNMAEDSKSVPLIDKGSEAIEFTNWVDKAFTNLFNGEWECFDEKYCEKYGFMLDETYKTDFLYKTFKNPT